MVALSDLVTSGTIRGRLGWPNSSTVHRRIDRSGFPKPVATLSRTMIWLWPDVVEWCNERGVKFLEPSTTVSLELIAERLSIGYNDLAKFGVEPVLVVDGVEHWLWSDAEDVALNVMNTVKHL